jgi:hypothetical protein
MKKIITPGLSRWSIFPAASSAQIATNSIGILTGIR